MPKQPNLVLKHNVKLAVFYIALFPIIITKTTIIINILINHSFNCIVT